MRQYIAAGLDPARFWDLTPRLYQIEMQGAAERMKRQRALVWYGAMLPNAKNPPSFEKFTGYVPDRAEFVQRWSEAWDRIDQALKRKH